MDVISRLQTVIKASAHQRERLAAALSVSASTIDRWAAGSVQPTSKHLLALREALADFYAPAKQEHVLRALGQCLAQAREVMHKYGAASSRNDALDQISLLLSVHLHLRRTGRLGIQSVDKDQIGEVLSASVTELEAQAPVSTRHRLAHAAAEMSRKKSYLSEIISALRPALDEIDEREEWKRPHDFHEIFVNFLASSFHEEKEFAQYMTPREVVDFMVRVAIALYDEDDYPVVLDPSCGTASFLTSFAETYADKLGVDHGASRAATAYDPAARLVGVDTSERMIRLAAASFVAAGIEPRGLFLDSSIEPIGTDAQSVLCANSISVILTNPPFGAEHSRGRHGGGRVPSEVVYLERYCEWLKPGGVALSIIPDSILTNKGIFAELRAHLLQRVDLIAVVSLPPVTFAASGTTTKTSIIVFRKKNGMSARPALFAVASNVGFDVSTRGSIRRRVAHPKNDLPEIADAIIFGLESSAAAICSVEPDLERWDAQFLTSPLARSSPVPGSVDPSTPVASVASLVKDRADPRSELNETFDYIEISNVDGELLRVSASKVLTVEAPSRARRRVRAGDVLVSTVRPDRKTVGVVPPHLDGAICSTGFAVLRTNAVSPYVLAAALKAPDVTAQLIGVSSGVAYPVFDPDALPAIRINLGDRNWQVSCERFGATLNALEVQRQAVFPG